MAPTSANSDPYANWKHWLPEEFLQMRPEKARYFDWHVGRATGGSGKKLRILEIGFGNGEFLGWARARGHHIVGLELSKHLVQLARSAGFEAHDDIEELPAEMHFDLIVGIDVLEHIAPTEIGAFLHRLRGLLSKQETMLFRFPNAESPLGSIYQHGDVTHVNALGVSKMLQLCASTGLALKCQGEALPLRTLPLRSLPRGVTSLIIRSTLQFVLGRLLLGHPIRIAANEMVVLARALPDE